MTADYSGIDVSVIYITTYVRQFGINTNHAVQATSMRIEIFINTNIL